MVTQQHRLRVLPITPVRHGRTSQEQACAALLEQLEPSGLAYLAALVRGGAAAEREQARQAWRATIDALIAAVRDLDHDSPTVGG
jgi:hypothetical protein